MHTGTSSDGDSDLSYSLLAMLKMEKLGRLYLRWALEIKVMEVLFS